LRSRFILVGVAALAAGLAACGGGGGISLPATTPTPAPTPTPGYYDTSLPSNAAFTFKGTLLTQTSYNYPNDGVATPYPNSSTSVNVTQVASIITGQNPYGATTTVQTVETDAQQLRSTTLTSQAYFKPSVEAFTELLETSNDGTGDSYTYDYTKSPLVLDFIPEHPGASWSNSAAVVYTEKDADGSTASRTVNADGSYTENDTQPGAGVQATITENADGTGVYSSNNTLLDGNFNNLAFGTPTPQYIPVTATWSSNIPAPTPTPRLYTPAPWFSPSPTLYKETDTISAATFPNSCAVPAGYGASGNEIVQAINRLDTILGYTEQETITTYTAPNFGPVCLVLNDSQTTYYDYLDDYEDSSGAHLHFIGGPLATTTTQETLTLQSGALVSSTAHTTSAKARTSSVLQLPQVVIARNAFERHVDQERRDRARAFRAFAAHKGATK